MNQNHIHIRLFSLREITVWFLLTAIGGFLISYVYFINQAVRTTLMQKDVAARSEEITTRIGKHEAMLFSAALGMTLEAAKRLSLKPLEPMFVPREESGPVLSLRGNDE